MPKPIKLPEGYKLKSDVKFDEQLNRYLWLPKKNDLFYFEKTKTIFKYLEWTAYLKGNWMSMDGYAKVKDLKDNEEFWTNNLEVRKCIPIEVI